MTDLTDRTVDRQAHRQAQWSMPALVWLRDHPATVLIPLMATIACLGYAGIFARWTYLVPVVTAAVGATAVATIAHRKEWLLGEIIVASTLGFVVVGLIVTQWVPGPSSPLDFASALANGWATLLSSQAPVDLQKTVAVVPFTTAWVATAVAHELHHRVPVFGIALIGILVGLVATSLFSIEARSIATVQGPLLVVAALLLAFLQRQQHDAIEGTSQTPTMSRSSGSRWVVLMLGAVGLITALVAPRLPFIDDQQRFDLRDLQENPWDPLTEPSPLVTLKASLKEGASETLLFRVQSDVPIERFTLAVMASFDGVVWQVADPQGNAPAQFVPVDSNLPTTAHEPATEPVRVDIEIVNLTGPWVPHTGTPIELRFDQPAEVRLNLSTATVATPQGLRPGDSYQLVGLPHPEQPLVLSETPIAVSEDEVVLDAVPSSILNVTASLVEGVDFGGAQVQAIQSLLVNEGFYDAGSSRPPGHSYAQIAAFLDDPERIVGYEEQYAAAAGVLTRVAGIPSRVVTGFAIEPGRYQNGVAEVMGADATAWVEVLFDDIGWVPIEVTPDRSREPTEQGLGRTTRNVSIPNEPPPPPPPLDSRPIDPPEEEEPDRELDEEQEDSTEGRSLVDALLDRPGLIAGTVAISPFIVFALLAAIAAALKRRRQRSRRQAANSRLRIGGAWAELVDRFEEVGHRIPQNAAPLEIAEQLLDDDALDPAEPAIRELASLVSKSAFSQGEPSESEVDRAWECADIATDVAVADLDAVDRLRIRVDPRPLMRTGPQGDRSE